MDSYQTPPPAYEPDEPLDPLTLGEARHLSITARTQNNVEDLTILNLGPCAA